MFINATDFVGDELGRGETFTHLVSLFLAQRGNKWCIARVLRGEFDNCGAFRGVEKHEMPAWVGFGEGIAVVNERVVVNDGIEVCLVDRVGKVGGSHGGLPFNYGVYFRCDIFSLFLRVGLVKHF